MKQLIANKFSTSKLRPEMDIWEVVTAQYDYEFSKDNKVSVSDLYMPTIEQDNMADWIIKNLLKFKKINKKFINKEMAMVRLDIFPSEYKRDDN